MDRPCDVTAELPARALAPTLRKSRIMNDLWRKALIGLAAAGAAVAFYAFVVETRWLEVRRGTIHLRRLPASLEGLRIGLLSDLHVRDEDSLRLVERACRALEREHPHLIAVTGDFAGPPLRSFHPILEVLARLSPPLGTYAVPGNHDHSMGVRRWRRDLAEHPSIVDLTNRSTTIQLEDARLCVAGVDDLEKGMPSLDSLPDPADRDLTILLAHNPEQAERARRRDDHVDLVLSGHTHGGQIRLPLVGALVSSVDRDDLYEDGLRRRPWTQVYTSRGLGTVHLPARLLARPEVSVLTLTAAPRPTWRGGRGRSRARAESAKP